MQRGIAAVRIPADYITWTVLARISREIVQESRVSVQIIFLVRFCTAAALGAAVLGPTVWVAAAAWLLSTIAAYVFNGVMDRTEDRANGSTRPISRGSLPVPVALAGVAGAAATAVLLAWAVDPSGLLMLLVLGNLALGYAYSGAPFYGKRRGDTAALLVLGSGVLTYAAGWQAAGRLGGLPVLVLGAAMSLWMACVGAVVKDLSDVEGDAAAGRRTPAVVWGATRVRVLAGANAALIAGGYLTVALTVAPVLLPSAFALVAGALGVIVLAAATGRADTRAGRRLPYQAYMVAQYAVHIVVLVTLIPAAVL